MSGYKTHRFSQEPDDYEGPWPEEKTMTKPTVDEVMLLVREFGDAQAQLASYRSTSNRRECLLRVRAAIESLIAAPAAPQQAEPVAWMFDRRYGSGLSFGRPADYENEDGDMVSPTPLYRHPPADEVQGLRDAASALCGALTASELDDRACHALNALHRALEGK